MPIKAEIVRDGRVYYAVMTNPLGLKDLETGFNVFYNRLKVSPDIVHAITDIRDLNIVPPNLVSYTITNFRHIMTHEKSGAFVIIVRNQFLRALSMAIGRFVPGLTMIYVLTPEQAWARIDDLLATEKPRQSSV
jgi:hypothetical protein